MKKAIEYLENRIEQLESNSKVISKARDIVGIELSVTLQEVERDIHKTIDEFQEAVDFLSGKQ
jgi:prefoldin subunit 5